MGAWLSGIFTGNDPTLSQNIGKFGSEGDFATGTGQGDVTAASNFYTGILSGDQTKEAEALAPEIGAIKGQAQQQKKTIANTSTRSGGTAAEAGAIDDKVTGDITGLLGSEKSSAASGAASLGTSEQSLGLQSQAEQDKAAQQQLENWKKSLFGDAITTGAGAAEGAGLAAIGI